MFHYFRKKQHYCLRITKTSTRAFWDTEVMQIKKGHGSQIKKKKEEKLCVAHIPSTAFSEED